MNIHTGLFRGVCSAALLIGLSHAGPAYAADAEDLLGANENPPVASDGEGEFDFKIRDGSIEFELEFDVVSGASDAMQSHIHIANPGNNGGITVFLCTNLGNAPAGVTSRPCPPSPGAVEGVIVAGDVLGVVGDNGVVLQAGDLEGLVRLMKDGATYVNVHTADHPSGEIRGQINPRRR